MVFAIFLCVSCRLVLYNVIFQFMMTKYSIENIYHNNDDTKNYMFNWFEKLLSVWESKKSIVSSQFASKSSIENLLILFYASSTVYTIQWFIEYRHITDCFASLFLVHPTRSKFLLNVSQAFKSILNLWVFFSLVFEKKHWRRS